LKYLTSWIQGTEALNLKQEKEDLLRLNRIRVHATKVFLLSVSFLPLKRHTGNGFLSWSYCYVYVAHISPGREATHDLLLVLQLDLPSIVWEAASSLIATEQQGNATD